MSVRPHERVCEATSPLPGSHGARDMIFHFSLLCVLGRLGAVGAEARCTCRQGAYDVVFFGCAHDGL